ncbi:hypothetical protein F4808DRAFT_475205 [Astrocystis sublimbata]|nr:hypothetical protein F4808DRAFT_475205 [Astrocystis sublimbata]
MGTNFFSWIKRGLRETGWRLAAKINCVVLLVSSLVLTTLSIVALARGSLKPVFFYAADCGSGEATVVNLALHLSINIVSTLVVLNAPTREEVDNAHSKASWLGIGVPSVRNAFQVSSFKTWSWVCLFVSTVPIHLIWNSAIFEVDRRDSDYHLTIATEQFLHGGSFYPPGASLALPGLVSDDDSAWYEMLDGYGARINRSDYQNPLSPAVSNISAIADKAAEWERLEVAECLSEYVHCKGLKKHRSVVLVVEELDGWAWNDIWHLNETEADFWETYIPKYTPNHLFFDTQCAMVAWSYEKFVPGCWNDCAGALGTDFDMRNDWSYPFFSGRGKEVVNGTYYRYSDTGPRIWERSPAQTMTSGLQHGAFNLSINHCRAEPVENTCRIAASPVLLLGVTLCVIAKSITAVVVTVVLSRPEHKPLVTLGDAVASFIEHPDPITAGFCTVDQRHFHNAIKRKYKYLLPGPRHWISSRPLFSTIVPLSVWIISYSLFAGGITLCAVHIQKALSDMSHSGSFLAGDNNSFIPLSFNLIQGVLLANSPQLLLSFCYLAYNNLFTRLQAGREWARFGEDCISLRVTEPRGQQRSTYRLQLPYRYSIPLIIVSAFLHWLLSNSIYVFVSTGGFYHAYYYVERNEEYDPTLPPNTNVSVGYSVTSLIVLVSVTSVLITVPIILSFRRLPSNITHPGSNSLAISAACHSSALTQASKESLAATEDRGINYDDDDDSDTDTPLRRLAQSKIRWGVISMPPEWHDEYDHAHSIEHLGFGVEEDNPGDPIPGHMYA